MCCFFAALLFGGPRLGMLIFWLFPYGARSINQAFRGFNYPWLVIILGIVFVPWAMLMYLIVYPVTGFDWVWIGIGLAADIFGWMRGDRHRHSVPGYTDTVATIDPADTPPPAAPPATPPAAPAA